MHRDDVTDQGYRTTLFYVTSLSRVIRPNNDPKTKSLLAKPATLFPSVRRDSVATQLQAEDIRDYGTRTVITTVLPDCPKRHRGELPSGRFAGR